MTNKRTFFLLALFTLLTIFSMSVVTATDVDEEGIPVGDFVGRIYYDDVADIEQLIAFNIDLHEYNNLAEQYVLGGMNKTIYTDLKASGWEVSVDAIATAAFNVPRSQDATPETYYGGYRTVVEIYDILDDTNAAHPDITELFDYGDSYCKTNGCNVNGTFNGYDLRAIRFANENNPDAPIGFGNRPAFFLMAAIHSRELTTAEQAVFYIDYLADNYGSDPDVTWLVDWHDIYIVPVANPDGRYVVETINTPSSQRKNAHQTANCGWGFSFSQNGIDLNRNHSHRWNNGGSSGSQCNLTYRGTSAASEPEVDLLQQFVRTIIPDQRGTGDSDAAPDDAMGIFITMHSYSDLVLWPWGYTTGAAPNRDGLKAVGDKLGDLTGYTSCQPSICLYNASGTTDDWSYGELGVASFTYEIGGGGDGFFPNYTTASTTHWAEVGESLEYSARIARAPYMLAEGPDVDNLTMTVVRSTEFMVNATVDDGDNGNNAITSASLYIDIPYWQAGATPIALSASDGNFNSVQESVEGMIDICDLGLANGDHTLWVRGEDAAGNAGPVWATILTVTDADDCTPTAITGISGATTSQAQIGLILLVALLAVTGVSIVGLRRS